MDVTKAALQLKFSGFMTRRRKLKTLTQLIDEMNEFLKKVSTEHLKDSQLSYYGFTDEPMLLQTRDNPLSPQMAINEIMFCHNFMTGSIYNKALSQKVVLPNNNLPYFWAEIPGLGSLKWEPADPLIINSLRPNKGQKSIELDMNDDVLLMNLYASGNECMLPKQALEYVIDNEIKDADFEQLAKERNGFHNANTNFTLSIPSDDKLKGYIFRIAGIAKKYSSNGIGITLCSKVPIAGKDILYSTHKYVEKADLKKIMIESGPIQSDEVLF